jgi:hypothetical protein
MVGYQGLSSRSMSQRQSTTLASATQRWHGKLATNANLLFFFACRVRPRRRRDRQGSELIKLLFVAGMLAGVKARRHRAGRR